jgi:hypothetical protein
VDTGDTQTIQTEHQDFTTSMGGEIELDSGDTLSLIGGLKLTITFLIFGREVSGWSLGIGASF